MKRFLLLVLLLATISGSAMAWGKLGHDAVVAVAQRHLTEKAKTNIAKYMNYDLKEESVWMDKHRWDKEIAYTTHYHVFACDTQGNYDPNPRLSKGGDTVYAINLADYNLSQYERLTDSAVVMNLRMILHFVGDMHCPVHAHPEGKNTAWPCEFNGKQWKKFHAIYDRLPEMLYGKDVNPDALAAELDNCKKGEIRKIQGGTLLDWSKDCIAQNLSIYEINPFQATQVASDTVERSRDVIARQLRNAGYRLAYCLNKYFDK